MVGSFPEWGARGLSSKLPHARPTRTINIQTKPSIGMGDSPRNPLVLGIAPENQRWVSGIPRKPFTPSKNVRRSMVLFGWAAASSGLKPLTAVRTHSCHTKHRQGDTGWRRLIGSPKLQIIFHKRATKYRSLLRSRSFSTKEPLNIGHFFLVTGSPWRKTQYA